MEWFKTCQSLQSGIMIELPFEDRIKKAIEMKFDNPSHGEIDVMVSWFDVDGTKVSQKYRLPLNETIEL